MCGKGQVCILDIDSTRARALPSSQCDSQGGAAERERLSVAVQGVKSVHRAWSDAPAPSVLYQNDDSSVENDDSSLENDDYTVEKS